MPHRKNHLALVLSGGGARGAYEAGVIHYIRTALPKKIAHKAVFEIQCGSSVGAINTCFMASMAHDLKKQGEDIFKLWNQIDQNRVYARNVKALVTTLTRSIRGVSHNIFTLNPFNLNVKKTSMAHFRGLLDTAPLPDYLESLIDYKKIKENIKKDRLRAVSLTATNSETGQMELFIQKQKKVNYVGDYIFHDVDLKVEHTMASAAIPIIFPPIKIGKTYYVDGGLRLNTPLSPAIHLGANRVMVIGLHHRQGLRELPKVTIPDQEDHHPSLGQLVGLVMDALFLDRIEYDIKQSTRINSIIEWGMKVYGNDFLDKINHMLVEEGLSVDIGARGLKELDIFHMEPSVDISDIFSECYQKNHGEKDLNLFEKILFRFLDVDPVAGVEILSYLIFMPSYIKKLLDLGFEDARSKHDEILQFLSH